jgi:phosphinothricin acetyltransferase
VSRRKAYAGVAEVSVYVAAERRGHGIGRALLENLIVASEENRI